MVKFVIPGVSDLPPYSPPFHRADSYWKLGFYKQKTARECVIYLEEHGYKCGKDIRLPLAMKAVGRQQCGLMSYRGFDIPEL